MMTPITTEEDFNGLLRDCADHPVLLMKHSSRCPVSAAAHRQVEKFEAETGADCRVVLVIEQRPLSQQIAQETGVAHQSPQVILFAGSRPVGSLAHWNITGEGVKRLYSDNGLPVSR